MTTKAASHERDLSASWTAELDFRGFAFDLVAIAFAMAVGFAVGRAPIGSGDYGQWLMVSRFFSGDDVPSYRNLTSVAPLVPLLLAIIRTAVSDPVVALNVLRVFLVLAVVMSFYVAGGSLFRSRAAGLWSAIFPAVLTDQFLEMLAFGGILQLAGVIFLLLSLAAVAMAGRRGVGAGSWWTAAAAALALAIASHAGSVVVIVPTVGIAALLVLWKDQGRHRWREWPRELSAAAMIAGIAFAYWLVVLLPANRDYANNPASLTYRGPDRLFDGLTDSTPELALIALGVLGLGWGLGRSFGRRRIDGYVIVAGWTLVTFGFVAATIIGGAATDYPRFAPLMLAPLALAGGALCAEACGALQRVLARYEPDLASFDPTFVLVAVLMLAFGARELGDFRVHANGYAMTDMESLHTVAGWVDRNIKDDQFVLVSSGREAKWIEGLSGESTLFSSPVRYDFRRSGWPRSIAAEALLRSTTSIVNGSWFAMFTSAASTETKDVPRELLLGMNHGGEYLDALRLPDANAKVLSPTADQGVLATLGALKPQDVDRIETDDTSMVRTTWSGSRPTGSVAWTREVSLTDGNQGLTIMDRVTGDAPMSGMEVLLSQIGSQRITGVEFDPQGAIIRLTKSGIKQPAMRVEARGGNVQMEQVEGGLRVVSNATTLELTITPLSNGADIADRELLYPPQLIEDWHIGAVVLTHGPATEARVKRLQALGFREELDIGAYLVLVPEYFGGGERMPAPDARPSTPPTASPTPTPTVGETPTAEPTAAVDTETVAPIAPVTSDEAWNPATAPAVVETESPVITPTTGTAQPPTSQPETPTNVGVIPTVVVTPRPPTATPTVEPTPTPQPDPTKPGRGNGGGNGGGRGNGGGGRN